MKHVVLGTMTQQLKTSSIEPLELSYFRDDNDKEREEEKRENARCSCLTITTSICII